MSYDNWLVEPYEQQARDDAEAEYIVSCTCRQCSTRADAPLDDELCDACAELLGEVTP